jgi:hypothetical protein
MRRGFFNPTRRIEVAKTTEEKKLSARETRKRHGERYKQKNGAIRLADVKRCKQNLKILVLTYYSNGTPRCACCGELNVLFLTIDHIDNGGNKHRKEIGAGNLYRWLRDERPAGYRVLCFNCNCGRAINNGVCPHKGINNE